MTFNDDAQLGGTTARRRGRGTMVAGGVGGVGVLGLVIVLINVFTGGQLGGLLGLDGSGGDPQAGDTVIQDCETGADANDRDDCRLVFGQKSIDAYWEQRVEGYRPAQLIIVDQQTSTQCGTASNATGPFYCPPEETIYVDPTFFALLGSQFDATVGPLAQLYVLAHEYGHHLQQLTGAFDRYPSNGSGPASNGVRTELQADCYAGAWVAGAADQKDANGVPYLKPPTAAQIRDALEAAATVGDDHIQQETTGRIDPERWTHGSSEQRQRWFTTGMNDGPAACHAAFRVSGGDL